jgi:hypothetical protein
LSLEAILRSGKPTKKRQLPVAPATLKILWSIKALSEKSGYQFEALKKSLAGAGSRAKKV